MIVDGVIELNDGSGLSSVTVEDPKTLEFAESTASTNTVFGVGRLAGAVYTPLLLTVPGSPLNDAAVETTFHTIVAGYSIPAVEAENVFVWPTRTVAVAGLTLMIGAVAAITSGA